MMYTPVDHETEVKELFEKVSVAIPGIEDARAISLEGFKVAIDNMMNKAFYYGSQQTLQSAEDVIDRVFNQRR